MEKQKKPTALDLQSKGLLSLILMLDLWFPAQWWGLTDA